MNAGQELNAPAQRVMVLGLGRTGYSVIRHLAGSGARIFAADSRECPPCLKNVRGEFPGVEITTGGIPRETLAGFDRVVVSPGVDIAEAGAGDLNPVGDIELFAESVRAPVIGVTGSNGKSTVTMLVREMLLAAGRSVQAGGNLGTPALELLDAPVPDFYVLELSSFQLESTYSLKPAAATVLNVSEDHMDRYRGLEEYAAAKARIFNGAAALVYNRDDARSAAGRTAARVLSFGMDEPPGAEDFGVAARDGERLLVRGRSVLVERARVTLPGEQNVANLLAALALVHACGVELTPAVVNAGANYRGLPHRCEIVTEVERVTWVNDSKGTNVGATVAAINGFADNIILIAGGRGKGADFAALAAAAAGRVRHAVLIGEDAGVIAAALGEDVEHTLAPSLEQAVLTARRLAAPGGVVLFSPACASFDMFDNYEHRGDEFRRLVLERVH